jgi:uncharacterized protein with HEPN domain
MTVKRLLDIAEAIERINKYADRGREAFENDELIQNWILHHLQVLGEAAAKISSEFQEANQIIPWSKIIGMRNILVHDYFGIDTEIVWTVVEKELPDLKASVKTLIEENA